MARQANGQYQQPANTAAVSGQTISSTAFNTLVTDIGSELTNSLDRAGRSAMTANLPMGGNRITGAAEPTVSSDVATKNYVDTAASFSTGDVKLTFKTAADIGWVLLTSASFGNGTLGNVGSGGNIRANADCQPLFNLIFNNLSDANAPIFTSGGAATTRAAQTDAATAWAALCQIQIGFWAGRSIGIAGNPAELPSFRALGAHIGAETLTIAQANLPNITLGTTVTITDTGHNHTATVTDTGHTHSNTLTDTGHSHNVQVPQQGNNTGSLVTSKFRPGDNGAAATTLNVATDTTSTGITINNASRVTGVTVANTATTTGITASGTTPLGGSATAVSLYQPTSFMNAMVKL